jgi:hypothetical protein
MPNIVLGTVVMLQKPTLYNYKWSDGAVRDYSNVFTDSLLSGPIRHPYLQERRNRSLNEYPHILQNL